MGLRYYTDNRNISHKHLAISKLQRRKSSGQTLAEYALILAFVSVVAIGVLMSMGSHVNAVYSTVNAQLYASKYGGVTTRSPGH